MKITDKRLLYIDLNQQDIVRVLTEHAFKELYSRGKVASASPDLKKVDYTCTLSGGDGCSEGCDTSGDYTPITFLLSIKSGDEAPSK